MQPWPPPHHNGDTLESCWVNWPFNLSEAAAGYLTGNYSFYVLGLFGVEEEEAAEFTAQQ